MSEVLCNASPKKMSASLLLLFIFLGAGTASAVDTVSLLDLQFEESIWNGTSGEVIDSSGNGHHGRVNNNSTPVGTLPALTGNPGTCGYASQNDGSIEITGLPLDTSTHGVKTTVTFWMNWNGTDNSMPIGWNIHDIWIIGGSMGFNTGNGDLYGISSAGLANGWHHVAVEFTNGSVTSNRMHIDGVEQVLTQRRNTPNDSRAFVDSELRIGGWSVNSGYDFHGLMDEVRVYQKALTTPQVNTIMEERHSCPSSPLAEYRLDELSWEGSPNEVLDNSGNNNHGVAIGMTTLPTGKICAAGDFTTTGTSDYLSLANTAANGLSDFTVSVWANKNVVNTGTILSGAHAGQKNEMIMFFSGTSLFSPYIKGSRVNLNNGGIGDGNWHHLVWTRAGTNQCYYVDGALVQCKNGGGSGALTIDSGGLIIGQEQDSLGGGFDANQAWDGLLDELIIFNSALPMSQINTIYTHQNAGNNYDGSTRSCPAPAIPLLDYRFEEDSWNGSSDEILDNTGNGHHAQVHNNSTPATLSPALSGDPGTCGYASQNDGSIQVSGLPLDTSTIGVKTTVTFWMNWDGTNSAMPVGWNFHDIWLFGDSMGFNSFGGDIYGISSAGLANGWHHVAVEFTNGSVTSNRMHIDGVEQILTQRRGSPNNARAFVNSQMRVGGVSNSGSYDFHGLLDEFRVYKSTLTTPQIVTIMEERHACSAAALDHFTIDHDSGGIHCTAEPVSVTARNADGSILTTYTGTIVLNTQTNDGTWSKAVTPGFSDTTANDGIASYTFAASDNGVVDFFLDYIEGDPVIDIDVYDGSIRDDDSEGNMVFAETGFTITRSALGNPAPDTIDYAMNHQIAGTDFDIHVAAFGTTPTDPACGVIESYTGGKTIELTTSRLNPTSGIVSVSGGGPVVFNQGRAVITANYRDVGSILVNVKEDGLVGSSLDFIVKPDRFLIEVNSAVISTDETGDIFATAGTNFVVTVTAQGFDGATAFTTPSYGNEEAPLVAESIGVSHLLVAPSGGSPGNLNNMSFAKIGNGIFSGDFNWDEVGIIDLTAAVEDSNYLGAGNVTNTFSNLGRFIPAYFELTGGSITAANSNTANFTYLDQPVLLYYSLTAKSALSSATITENYEGVFAKLNLDEFSDELTDVGPAPADKDVAYGVVDISTFTTYNGRLTAAGPGSTTSWIDGVINVIGLPLTINRGLSTEGPVDSIKMGLLVEDSDGVKFPLLDLDSNAAGGSVVDTVTMAPLPGNLLYGRVFVPPVYGPETPLGSSLDIPFFIQYFDGSRFISQLEDSATNYGLWSDSCTDANLSDGLQCSEAPVTVPLANAVEGTNNADFPMAIARPGLNNSGSLNITFTVDDWLKFDWDESSAGDEHPSSLVTFGRYRGHDRIIYWRENHSP